MLSPNASPVGVVRRYSVLNSMATVPQNIGMMVWKRLPRMEARVIPITPAPMLELRVVPLSSADMPKDTPIVSK